jgi:hypothetical protein
MNNATSARHVGFALLTFVAAACGGNTLDGGSTGASSGAISNRAADPDAAPVADAAPAPVADAAPPATDGTGCQVVVVTATTPSGGGPTIYTKGLSNPADATVAFIDSTPDGVFTVTCLAGSETRVSATFGPYTGVGDYALPLGALELGGKKSDRVCSVGISSGAPGVLRGFVSCPTAPFSDANVFAQSGAPIGLAAFDAKVR